MPEEIVFYAIRLKGTDKYLPMRVKQYGHSFSEPISIEKVPPRFFFTEKSVKAALTSWLLGKHRKTRDGGYNYMGDYDYEEYIDIIPQADRKREKMEIVVFSATETKVLSSENKE